jgi:hypothetical protein
MRSTTLQMDTFGKRAIEQYAESQASSPSAVVRTAALYYLADRETERHSWRVPRFLRESEPAEAGEELQIDIDDPTWAAIEREAARQGVSPALLTRHAVLYFLAELDRGRQSED